MAAAFVAAATVAEASVAALCTFFIILMYFDGLIFKNDIDSFP
jgi:hypothetical protein